MPVFYFVRFSISVKDGIGILVESPLIYFELFHNIKDAKIFREVYSITESEFRGKQIQCPEHSKKRLS